MPDAPQVASLPAALLRLGQQLRDAGYDEPVVLRRLGAEETYLGREELSLLGRRLTDDRLSELIRLFLVREPAPAQTVDADGVEFLQADRDRLTSSVAVQPWRGALVVHDWSGAADPEDHVVGAGGTTDAVANFTVRRPVRSALDLCTGSGAQAALVARHADRVVAVDLNPRALQLAAWTLGLNGIANVELRLGDVRDACEGEKFDLVTVNPPFVVSPDRRWLFRDAGEGIAHLLVVRMAELLGDDGFGTVLCQWGVRPGETWDDQPHAWVADRGCDAWILRQPTQEDVIDHAATWNIELRSADPRAFERTVDRWLEHFSRKGIERVVTAAVVLRRRQGPNWVRTDEAGSWPTESVGEDVERLFAGQTFIASLPGEESLLDVRLAPVDALRLDETRSFGAGGFELVAAQVRTRLPLRPKLNRAAVEVVRRLDGQVRLRDLPACEPALPAIRELVATGFLVPV